MCAPRTDDEIELNFHLRKPHWAVNAPLNRSSACLAWELGVGRDPLFCPPVCAASIMPFGQLGKVVEEGGGIFGLAGPPAKVMLLPTPWLKNFYRFRNLRMALPACALTSTSASVGSFHRTRQRRMMMIFMPLNSFTVAHPSALTDYPYNNFFRSDGFTSGL